MSILSDKEKVFGNISALRTLTDDFPQLKTNNSFPSINNSANSQDFLIDLVLSLTGFEELRDTLIDILSYASETMEDLVKDSLKVELKSFTSCGVDPSLPAWLQSTGSGIEIEVKKIDFFEIFKVDPETQAGNLLYEDISVQLNSTDFNTFLYYTIQDAGPQSWDNILDFQFSQNASVPFNTLTINANPAYDNLTLTQLNNDFIDSLTIFPSTQLITRIIDGLFGSVSFNLSVNKSESQLELEEQVNTIIDCISSADGDYVIDDTYFEFTNEQLQDIKQRATNRRNGIRQIKTCGDVNVDLPIDFLTEIKEQFSAATLTGGRFEQHEVIKDGINSMANHVSTYAGDPVDEYSVQLDFLGLMFKSLIRAFVNAILGPKIVAIFVLNYKIVYGQNAEYTNFVDLLRQNKTLMLNIINKIRDIIITVLLQLVLKYITKLIAANQVEALKEKANAQLAILLSLVGVPQDVIRLIRENSPITF